MKSVSLIIGGLGVFVGFLFCLLMFITGATLLHLPAPGATGSVLCVAFLAYMCKLAYEKARDERERREAAVLASVERQAAAEREAVRDAARDVQHNHLWDDL